MQLISFFKVTNTKTQTLYHSVLLALLFFPFLVFSQNDFPYGIKKVVIDAGHGGKDPGSIGKYTQEKDITLALALKVGSYIEKNHKDVEVIYTRKDDTFIGLNERSQIANESEANLFISIHCNSNPSSSPYGTETYVMGLHKSNDNLEVAIRENAVVTYEEDYTSKYEGFDPNSSESFIIFSLMQNAFLDQSLAIASSIQSEFRDRAQRKDRGVKQAGFLVLWKTSMPSVLVEVGFLSNPREEAFISSEQGKEYLASAIYRAFRSYKETIDAKGVLLAQDKFDSTLKNAQAAKQTETTTSWQKETTSDTPSDIEFMVQIIVSSKQLAMNSEHFKGFSPVEEIKLNTIYKYAVGRETSYEKIQEYCAKVKTRFPDAFIIAFRKGQQIPLDEALKLKSN